MPVDYFKQEPLSIENLIDGLLRLRLRMGCFAPSTPADVRSSDDVVALEGVLPEVRRDARV